MLKAGIDPNEVDSGSEKTPLGHYARQGNVEACRALLQFGAVSDGDPATGRAGLELCIDPPKPDEKGITPLANTAAAGMVANMTMLLDQGVSPDCAGPSGVPPIWMAADNGQTRTVCLLLWRGEKGGAA